MQQIRYLLAVLDQGSFSRGAEYCHVSQPTLSSQIAKMEEELGMELLNRLTKPISPAPKARELIRSARAAYQGFDSLGLLAQEARGSRGGKLRLGIIPTLAPYLLPLFIKAFLADHPDLKLEIREAQSEDILGQIEDFQLDVGILALPSGHGGLVERSLFMEEFVAYMPPGPWPQKTVELSRLDWDEMLLLTEGHCLRDQVLDLCGKPTLESQRPVSFETGSLESLIKLVDLGMGYTLLPELATLDFPKEKTDRLLYLEPQPPVRDIGLVYHPAYPRKSLVDQVKSSITMASMPKLRPKGESRYLPWRKNPKF